MLAERLLAPVREARRRHARARLHALPAARPHDRRRHGPRRRARVERRRDRVRGPRAPARPRSRVPTEPTRDSRHVFITSRRRRDVPARSACGSSVPEVASRGGVVVELTVLGCSGSYGAPAGGACSGYLVRGGRPGRSGSTAATARFANLQQHIDRRGPHRGRHHARAPRPLRRHLRPARAVTYGLDRNASRCTRPKGVEKTSQLLVGDWTDTFDWRMVGDGDAADDRRHRPARSRAPTTRRRRSRSRSRTTASGSSTPPTPDRSGASTRSAPGADLVLSEATYQHDDIRAPIHLSARQAGEAAREAARGSV